MFVLLTMLICGLSAPVPLTATPSPVRNITSSRCVLPKMPANGAYVIQNNDGVFTPGSSVEDMTILEYTCNKGYVVTKRISVCQSTIWVPIPVCEKLCKKLRSNSVNLACNPVMEDGCPVGSVITPSCKAGYRSNRTLKTMMCLGGTWNIQKPKCKLITCELKTSNSVDFMCYNSNYSAIPCSKKIVEGKTVYFACKEGFSRVEGMDGKGGMFCRGGQWDRPTPWCSPIPSTTTPQPELHESKCALPSYPSHGTFTVSDPNKNLLPGTIVEEYTIITYSCDTNYDASTEIVHAYCEAGKWVTPPPICRKRCPMVQSLSVDFTCYKSGTEMDCPKFLPYGSVINSTCKIGHENLSEDLEDLMCAEDGKWDKPVPSCGTDCGLEKAFGEEQIVNGVTVKKDTFPWHVAIFQWDETTDTFQQICGGSIIHTNLVISAAHCFFDPIKLEQIDAKYVKVAAGKFLRSWDSDLTENIKLIQKSDVTAVYLPSRYSGGEQNQQSDLALLQLTSPFRLENSVRAVCYELLNERFDTLQTQPGRLGKVAVWGRTENGEPSDELKTLDLPVIGYRECHNEMSKYKFSKYLTTDKLCAGYRNGAQLTSVDGETTSHQKGTFYRTIRLLEHSNKPVYVFDGKPHEMKSSELVKRADRREDAQKELDKATEAGRAMCQGDSGGGLVFPAMDREGSTRWYLRGVVSNGPLNDAKTSCRSITYSTFTHIFKMRNWLRKKIRYVSRSIFSNNVNK